MLTAKEAKDIVDLAFTIKSQKQLEMIEKKILENVQNNKYELVVYEKIESPVQKKLENAGYKIFSIESDFYEPDVDRTTVIRWS